MRVRTFELRLLAVVLTALWALACAVVILGYSPGGPIDRLVGLAAAGPALVAATAIAWPPVVRDARAQALIGWLALGAALLLIPSTADLLGQLLARGPQTLLPSLEAVYTLLLALLATSLFAGLGIARRILGSGSMRNRRLVLGLALALGMTAGSAVAFGSAALANDFALRDRPASSSRFGPTDPDASLPPCDGPLGAGSTAEVTLALSGEIDLRSIGDVHLSGIRSGEDFRWTAEVATQRALGQYGAARLGTRSWTRDPRQAWAPTTSSLATLTVDRQAIAAALSEENRIAGEDRGLAYIEGARARHCRIAVDGTIFRSAFPEVAWLVGDESLRHWRGELDYWIFGDQAVGRLEGWVNGETGALHPGGLLATVRVVMTATDRGQRVEIGPPGP